MELQGFGKGQAWTITAKTDLPKTHLKDYFKIGHWVKELLIDFETPDVLEFQLRDHKFNGFITDDPLNGPRKVMIWYGDVEIAMDVFSSSRSKRCTLETRVNSVLIKCSMYTDSEVTPNNITQVIWNSLFPAT